MKRSIRSSQPATKLSHHIRELQIRLFVSVIALGLVGFVVYQFYEPILAILRSPLDAPLYYSSPAGSFSFVMKICFTGSLAVTIPLLIYNLIMFVRPAFEKLISKKRVYMISGASAILAIMGGMFGFIFIIPASLHFFADFQVEGLNALISADSYLSLVTNVIITFMFVFQLPLLIAFIDSIKPLSPKSLLGMNKWVILGSLVVSLLVPFAFDLTTSLLIAAPIVVLFNMSIVVVILQHSNSTRRSHATMHATNLRLASELIARTAPTLELNDDLARDFVEELYKPQQQAPAQTAVQQNNRMDIRPIVSHPANKVASATRSPQQPRQNSLGTHVSVISDMVRAPRPNRALASQ